MDANRTAEIIPKFTNLLQRKKALFIHGDGKHTRRYLYAGDAADAIDTIIHKGEIGQTYNVDSRDEICNLDLAKKLLGIFDVGDKDAWIQHTVDRPFNDRRYAVDGTKLRKLGWKQRVTFDEGLATTVEWYGKFSNWWGPIDNILMAPFPVVKGDQVIAPEANRKIEAAVDAEAGVGADDHRNGKAKRKAEEDVDSSMLDGPASNGVEPATKKRKAEVMA